MRVLPSLLLLLFFASCQSLPSQGVEQHALSVSLATAEEALGNEDRAIIDRLVRVCSADMAAASGLRGEIGRIIGEASSRARVRARDLPVEERGEVLASLASIRAEQIQFDWQDADLKGKPLVGDRVSRVAKVAKGAVLPSLESGKVIYATVRARIIAMPPQTISAKANITWWSEQSGAQLLAESLAAVLAERMASRIEASALVEGLVARRVSGKLPL